MIGEIREIPEKARLCHEKNKRIRLPENVPYLGMGSSYFAPLALKYLGCNIFPEIASEYYYFLSKTRHSDLAVLLSQSGYSSETLWNIGLFREYIAIVNDIDSPLVSSDKLKYLVGLYAGEEKFSSTKTYVNTLVSLYLGLGIDCLDAVTAIEKSMKRYEEWGEQQAGIIYDNYRKGGLKGVYVIGNGPDIATVSEASLILTETTKIPFIPMALPQYDHGPKESAENTVVLVVQTTGPAEERTRSLVETIARAGAVTLVWEGRDVKEYLSPITAIVPFNFLACFLAGKLGVTETFSVGSKVTIVDLPGAEK